VRGLLNQILQLDREAEQARAQGDIGTYAQKQQQQSELLRQLESQLNR
jgi:hypothetical protein